MMSQTIEPSQSIATRNILIIAINSAQSIAPLQFDFLNIVQSRHGAIQQETAKPFKRRRHSAGAICTIW